MWQFFTERGKRVVQLAHREALELGHDVIGTEHLLLGLMVEGEGVAAKVLLQSGLDVGELRQRIVDSIGRGRPKDRPLDLPLSPRAKRVLDLAMREARNMSVNYVGTEHILLGLLGEGEGIAAQILTSAGFDLQKVHRDVMDLLSRGDGGDAGSVESAGGAREERKTKTPIIDQLSMDLTAMAEKGELDPVVGRSKEIARVMQILSRRRKNNPRTYWGSWSGKDRHCGGSCPAGGIWGSSRGAPEQAGGASQRGEPCGGNQVPGRVRGAHA